MYIRVNGIDLFYEKKGQERPIILLHGNGESHKIFDTLTRQLIPKFSVYAIDSRGHGKSGKTKRLDYGDMARDIAAFINELEIEKPMLYGFSDGGIIGLLLAIRYPALLSKLIISGANTRPDGINSMWTFLIKASYFFTRSGKDKLMLTQPNITDAELNSIAIPTLILAGSKDMIKAEHTKNIAQNIPGSALKILDGETHASYVINSEKLYGIIEPFL